MRKTLLKELGMQTAFSCCIYAVLFLLLWLTELIYPQLKGVLLPWTMADGAINWAFIVGIPASVIGTGYVLTIKNPSNYTGFYTGVIMSLLMSIQFFLQGMYDQVVLYLFIFIPFQIASLVTWRKDALKVTDPDKKEEPFAPKYLGTKQMLLALGIGLLIVAVNYYVLYRIHLSKPDTFFNTTLAIVGGITIAASFLANFLMIFKKNDAWLCWVIFALAGMVQFILLKNLFSLVLFATMLIIDASAQFAWLGMTKSSDFGWAGSEKYVDNLRARVHKNRKK